MLVDSHCHLDRLNFNDLHDGVADVLEKAKLQGVEHCLAVATSLEAFPQMMDCIGDFPQVFASCGMHPLYVQDHQYQQQAHRELATDPRVVAIGETGLDYYYTPETKPEQKRVFAEQIELAVELDKPLIIHTRDAKQDTLDLLKQHGAERCGGVLHCFTEDVDMAQAAIELGFYISCSGIVTFNSAKKLQQVFAQLPLERLLVETDSPYLAPVPHRGKENQPAYTREVAHFLARLKGVSMPELAAQTTDNFFRLFKLAEKQV